MSDTKLFLGWFEFQEFEIPESIPLGGSQAQIIHRFPGGARVVQAMGRDDEPISWSGLFTGPNAVDRARELDLMRVQGREQELLFFGYRFSVVIRRFCYQVQRYYRVPYQLDLEVVLDKTQAGPFNVADSLTEAITSDSTAAVGLGNGIGDSSLTGLLSTMDSAIKSVSDFAKATQATINGVLAPVSAVMSRVNILIGTVSNTVNSVVTLGGILPNSPIAQQASRLTGQVAAMTQLPLLYNLQSVAGRIQTNLNLINSGPNTRTVTVGGGTLYDVAAKQYGDATMWNAVAEANQLTDPNITSVKNLTIWNNPQTKQ